MVTDLQGTPVIPKAKTTEPEVIEADIIDNQPEVAGAKQVIPEITSALTGE